MFKLMDKKKFTIFREKFMLVLDLCLRTCWIITGYICINSGNHAMGPTGRLLVDFAIVISQTGKCKYGHIPMVR